MQICTAWYQTIHNIIFLKWKRCSIRVNAFKTDWEVLVSGFCFFCFFTKFHHTHLTILHWKYLYTLLQYFIKPWIIGNIYTVQAVDAKWCCYTSLCQHVDDLRSTMWCLRAGGKQYQWGHYKKNSTGEVYVITLSFHREVTSVTAKCIPLSSLIFQLLLPWAVFILFFKSALNASLMLSLLSVIGVSPH